MIVLLAGAALLLGYSGKLNKMEKTDDNSKLLDEYFKEASKVYSVPYDMMRAICMNESSYGKAYSVKKGMMNPNDVEGSKSDDGLSWGVMQMTLRTAKDFDISVTPQKLNNPKYSIDLAAKFLRSLRLQFKNERDIVMAYNQGAGNQKKFIEMEKKGNLLMTQFLQARMYYERYLSNKRRL